MDMYSVSVGNATMSLRNNDPYQVNAFQFNDEDMQMVFQLKSESSLEDLHNRAAAPEIGETGFDVSTPFFATANYLPGYRFTRALLSKTPMPWMKISSWWVT